MSGRTRVLLVDDHAIVRSGLRMLVESQADMEVVGDVATVAEALEVVGRTPIDVALVDLTLGGENGVDLIRALGARQPPTRAIALTMHDDSEHLSLVLAAGGSGYLPKQAAHTEVLSAIRVVAQGRAYVSVSLQQLHAPHPGQHAAAPPAAEQLARLTPREREILRLIALGLTHGEIAGELGISLKTVETHRMHLCEKLGLRARALLVRFAQSSGLLGDAPR